jgi:adenylate cyclase
MIRSFPFRQDSPAAGGLINLRADADGVIRHYNFASQSKDGYEPSLALAAYMMWLGLDWKRDVSFSRSDMRWSELSSTDFATMVPRRVPATPVLLNLRCPWSVESGPAAFDYINLGQLDNLFQRNASRLTSKPLNNKVVFVAYVAIGQADLGSTIFGYHEPLVYLHSTALNDLMQSRWIRRSNRAVDITWLFLALLILVAARYGRSKSSLLLCWVAGILIVVALGLASLLWLDLVVPTVTVTTLMTVATILEIGRRHTSEFVERQRLRNTLGLYFSPRVLNNVLRNPGRLEPKRVEITVLLTDLRNSTALAELLGTERMLDLLNRIFAVENEAVFAEEGSLEKPVGDQFLAYWGAPDPQPDSSDRAWRAALKLIEGMQSLRESLDSEVRELFGYGLAVHAGESLIANIGSAQFCHYGLVGDLINVTARVESLTKYYGVLALATRDVYDRFTTPPESRLVDRVVVKGKQTPVELFELRHKFSPENFQELAANYAAAFALYERGNFSEAHSRFQSLSKIDNPSAVLAQRFAQLEADPPKDWRGVFTLTTK